MSKLILLSGPTGIGFTGVLVGVTKAVVTFKFLNLLKINNIFAKCFHLHLSESISKSSIAMLLDCLPNSERFAENSSLNFK